MGYRCAAAAYRDAAAALGPEDLTNHYTTGVAFLHDELVPHLKQVLQELSGGVWDLSAYEAFAAGSDVDLIAHIVNSVCAKRSVSLYPGDWYGFRVGSPDQSRIEWNADGTGPLACLCVPSVRNGHVTAPMVAFLERAEACLLNLNLYPTLSDAEREQTAKDLHGVIGKSVLSVSFSRGFGLTVSQLGVILVPKGLPLVEEIRTQLSWFSYFYNAIAAKAFMAVDIAELQAVDRRRRSWVSSWLNHHDLPSVESGTYYVRSFSVKEALPEYLAPLRRDGVVRMCFKPPLV